MYSLTCSEPEKFCKNGFLTVKVKVETRLRWKINQIIRESIIGYDKITVRSSTAIVKFTTRNFGNSGGGALIRVTIVS